MDSTKPIAPTAAEIDAAADDHLIYDTVIIYLRLAGGRWAVDLHNSRASERLVSANAGIPPCFTHVDPDDHSCDYARELVAQFVPHPTLDRLHQLIGDALAEEAAWAENEFRDAMAASRYNLGPAPAIDEAESLTEPICSACGVPVDQHEVPGAYDDSGKPVIDLREWHRLGDAARAGGQGKKDLFFYDDERERAALTLSES